MVVMADNISKQKLKLIEQTFLFSNIDSLVVERIVADPCCTKESFTKGSVIYDQTHFRSCLGILLSGTVRVDKRTLDGKYMKMSSLASGECFGAAAMFTGRGEYATILTAEKRVEVLFIPEEVIRWAMQRDMTITENYIRYLSERIWFLNEKITSLTAGSAEQRLAVFLLERCADGGYHGSMIELSRQLHIGRASLYRAIEGLEEKKVLRHSGKEMEILDIDRLRQLAETQ